MVNLEGKVCIITGASGGIGRVIVEKLAKQKASLVLAARRLEVLEEIRESLPNKENVLCVKCDVTHQTD